MRPFSEAAEGIRTLDLLHGKQNEQRRFRAENLCKQLGLSTVTDESDSPAPNGYPGT
jgi:hypothetical protein